MPPLAIEILRHALAKQPYHRYATGAVMAADLRRLADAPGAGREGDSHDDGCASGAVRRRRTSCWWTGWKGNYPARACRVNNPSTFGPWEPTGPENLDACELADNEAASLVGRVLPVEIFAAIWFWLGGVALGLNLLPPNPSCHTRQHACHGDAGSFTGNRAPDPGCDCPHGWLFWRKWPPLSYHRVTSSLSTPSPAAPPIPRHPRCCAQHRDCLAHCRTHPRRLNGQVSGGGSRCLRCPLMEVTLGILELVRRIDPTYQQAEADGMWFFYSQMGLMAELILPGLAILEKAAEHLRSAVKSATCRGKCGAHS